MPNNVEVSVLENGDPLEPRHIMAGLHQPTERNGVPLSFGGIPVPRRGKSPHQHRLACFDDPVDDQDVWAYVPKAANAK